MLRMIFTPFWESTWIGRPCTVLWYRLCCQPPNLLTSGWAYGAEFKMKRSRGILRNTVSLNLFPVGVPNPPALRVTKGIWVESFKARWSRQGRAVNWSSKLWCCSEIRGAAIWISRWNKVHCAWQSHWYFGGQSSEMTHRAKIKVSAELWASSASGILCFLSFQRQPTFLGP